MPLVPRAVRIPLAVAVLALTVAGCGSSSGTSSTATTPVAAATTSASAGSSDAKASAGPLATPGADGSVAFDGVTVTGAADLSKAPTVTSAGTAPAKGLDVEDIVVGTGATATAESTVQVQYIGVLYQKGTQPFDSSWARGAGTAPAPASFSLQQVIPGFTEGIGGTDGVDPMRIGGRRIMIFPASLGYQDQAQDAIPAGSSLVFVVDLTGVS